MYNGIINVYKEAGFTSHDVVAKLRGIFVQRKIGHTGTLDPAATGVLPVCLGNGTKLVDMITDRSKVYEARVLLGVTTDTEDTTGTETGKRELAGEFFAGDSEGVADNIKRVLEGFTGGYDQIPPMYSAIKKDGKRLYELAREGKEIDRAARHVEIYSIELISVELPYFTMRVHCGKGTYIRSLCRDIGAQIGCGACMDRLCRTQVGRFTLSEALTLEELQKLKDEDRLSEEVIPVDVMFEEYMPVHAGEEYFKLIKNGNKVDSRICCGLYSPVRMYCDGVFYGIYELDDRKKEYYPVKMFACGE